MADFFDDSVTQDRVERDYFTSTEKYKKFVNPAPKIEGVDTESITKAVLKQVEGKIAQGGVAGTPGPKGDRGPAGPAGPAGGAGEATIPAELTAATSVTTALVKTDAINSHTAGATVSLKAPTRVEGLFMAGALGASGGQANFSTNAPANRPAVSIKSPNGQKAAPLQILLDTNVVAAFTPDGKLMITAPTEDNQAATKKYVDDAIAKAIAARG